MKPILVLNKPYGGRKPSAGGGVDLKRKPSGGGEPFLR